jgi:hypothetical protein
LASDIKEIQDLTIADTYGYHKAFLRQILQTMEAEIGAIATGVEEQYANVAENLYRHKQLERIQAGNAESQIALLVEDAKRLVREEFDAQDRSDLFKSVIDASEHYVDKRSWKGVLRRQHEQAVLLRSTMCDSESFVEQSTQGYKSNAAHCYKQIDFIRLVNSLIVLIMETAKTAIGMENLYNIIDTYKDNYKICDLAIELAVESQAMIFNLLDINNCVYGPMGVGAIAQNSELSKTKLGILLQIMASAFASGKKEEPRYGGPSMKDVPKEKVAHQYYSKIFGLTCTTKVNKTGIHSLDDYVNGEEGPIAVCKEFVYETCKDTDHKETLLAVGKMKTLKLYQLLAGKSSTINQLIGLTIRPDQVNDIKFLLKKRRNNHMWELAYLKRDATSTIHDTTDEPKSTFDGEQSELYCDARSVGTEYTQDSRVSSLKTSIMERSSDNDTQVRVSEPPVAELRSVSPETRQRQTKLHHNWKSTRTSIGLAFMTGNQFSMGMILKPLVFMLTLSLLSNTLIDRSRILGGGPLLYHQENFINSQLNELRSDQWMSTVIEHMATENIDSPEYSHSVRMRSPAEKFDIVYTSMTKSMVMLEAGSKGNEVFVIPVGVRTQTSEYMSEKVGSSSTSATIFTKGGLVSQSSSFRPRRKPDNNEHEADSSIRELLEANIAKHSQEGKFSEEVEFGDWTKDPREVFKVQTTEDLTWREANTVGSHKGDTEVLKQMCGFDVSRDIGVEQWGEHTEFSNQFDFVEGTVKVINMLGSLWSSMLFNDEISFDAEFPAVYSISGSTGGMYRGTLYGGVSVTMEQDHWKKNTSIFSVTGLSKSSVVYETNEGLIMESVYTRDSFTQRLNMECKFKTGDRIRMPQINLSDRAENLTTVYLANRIDGRISVIEAINVATVAMLTLVLELLDILELVKNLSLYAEAKIILICALVFKRVHIRRWHRMILYIAVTSALIVGGGTVIGIAAPINFGLYTEYKYSTNKHEDIVSTMGEHVGNLTIEHFGFSGTNQQDVRVWKVVRSVINTMAIFPNDIELGWFVALAIPVNIVLLIVLYKQVTAARKLMSGE